MKKALYIIAGAALLLTSCAKTLDKQPLDKLSADTFFESASGMEAYSNAFYGILPGTSLYLDNADNYYQMEQLLEAKGTRTVPASGSGWTWGYLRNYNTLLDNAEQCKDVAVRTKYVALARFFRAYFYFDKVKRFGDVPWIDTQLGSTDKRLYAPRDSREVVMQHIIEDLNFAIDNLSKDKTVYKISKWTAMALKSRVCLFEGTFRKYHEITGFENDADWYLNEAASVAYDFIKTSGYTIYADEKDSVNYRTLFTTNVIDGSAVAKEVILARNYNVAYSVVHNSNYQFLTGSMGRYGMTRKTVASYLMKDGSRFTDKPGWQTMQFKEESKDRDLRLFQSIRLPGYKRIGGTTTLAPELAQTLTGYQPIKYVTTEEYDSWDKSDNDLIIFRAGEVYLNYAEAKAELGKLTQDDLDMTVNKLRDRVGMPHMTVSVTVDPFLIDEEWGGYKNVTVDRKQRALILEIRRERTVELNQEGFRYYDLMRWKEGKIFEKQMYGMYFPGPGEYDLDGDGKMDVLLYEGETVPPSTATTKLQLEVDVKLSEKTKGMINTFRESPGHWNESKDYFYPIPTDELNLNKNLVQNPGW